VLFRSWRRDPLSEIRSESGFAYIAQTHSPGLSAHKRPSAALVIEDGIPLAGPANAVHEDIRRKGRGRFSFWHGYVYFSASDNSDPRTNGRCYEIDYPTFAARLGARFVPGLIARPKVALADSEPAVAVLRSGAMPSTSLNIESACPTAFQYVPWHTVLWQRIGITLRKDSILLDFGCGEGECLDQFRKAGFLTFGCDITFPDEPNSRLGSYLENGDIRKIRETPYRIPFEDNSFDIIFSNQVFEHVMDYDTVLAELRRILKPNGVGVHIFPGRWKMRESHTFVPFSSVIKGFWWSYLWARLGVRNQYAVGLSARETAKRYACYLKDHTNYLTRSQISGYVRKYFHDFRFAEEAFFLAYHPRLARVFARCPLLLEFVRALYSDTVMRLLVFGKKKTLEGAC